MEKYKLKDFAKWAKKQNISDLALTEVLDEMGRGLLGDRLGANIYKKRIQIEGRGKRGGGRIILLFKVQEIALFLYGYLKKEQDNITQNEEQQLRIFASEFTKLKPADRLCLKKEGKLLTIED